jgi:hypothetical protein
MALNLSKLMSHWELKNMVTEKHILYSTLVYDSDKTHTVRTAKITSSSDHAVILYTSDGGKLGLIHADIFFSRSKYGSYNKDQLFIKKANLTQLADYIK